MTDAEKRLWGALRARRLGDIEFRRQVPMGPYIADFVSHHARLVVEVDGSQHLEAPGRTADIRRDAWFEGRGYRVLRFSNIDVLTNTEGVLWTIGEVAGLWAAQDEVDRARAP